MNGRRPASQIRSAYYYFNSLTPGFKSFKAYLNWVRTNREMGKRVGEVRARPLKLTFEPTNVCQLHCPLCPTGLRIMERSGKHASSEMFGRLLREVGDYVFFIDFYNWGEPLLNPRLEELLELAHERNISTTISTNFSLKVSDDRLAKLIRSGLNHVIVSLDGASAESYTNYRRGGDFDLVMENVRRLIAIRDREHSLTPYVTWQYLIFKFNEGEMDRAQALAREIGVDRLWFAKASLDEGEYPLSSDDRDAIRKWVPSDPSHSHYDPREADSDPLIPLKQRAPLTRDRRNRCDWLYMTSAVNSDGSVAPCCAVFRNNDTFGQLGPGGQASYMEILNNERYRAIRNAFAGREEWPKDTECSLCSRTPLMDYSRGVNRWIVITTFVKLINFVMKPFLYLSGGGHRIVRPPLKIKWPD
jgi:MoaA/NifB/PqqE/SkfB family radical SAM enzyme